MWVNQEVKNLVNKTLRVMKFVYHAVYPEMLLMIYSIFPGEMMFAEFNQFTESNIRIWNFLILFEGF